MRRYVVTTEEIVEGPDHEHKIRLIEIEADLLLISEGGDLVFQNQEDQPTSSHTPNLTKKVPVTHTIFARGTWNSAKEIGS